MIRLRIIISLVVCITAFAFFTIYRVIRFYQFNKSPHTSFEGNLYRSDKQLGYDAIPSSRGYVVLANEIKTTALFDSNGFRVAQQEAQAIDSGSILFLGDSHTYGLGCNAEESFPYIVGRQLRLRSMNAGIWGYGFSQIILKARELIPKFKPDYVVVQVSPWTAKRSTLKYVPTEFVTIPCPYYISTEKRIGISEPVYTSVIFKLTALSETHQFKYRAKSLNDFIRFSYVMGFPVFLYDDWKEFQLWWKEIPKPLKNIDLIERKALEELHHLSTENGARLIVLLTAYDLNNKDEKQRLSELDKWITQHYSDVIVVKPDSVLWNSLEIRDNLEFDRKFHFWKGDTMVDAHPNPLAQKMIADEIVWALENDIRSFDR